MILPINALEGGVFPLLRMALLIITFSLILYRIVAAVRDPLRKVPGPFLARFTRLWLLREYIGPHHEKTNIELHKKYGPVVRIAPGQYSIDSPEAAKLIYAAGGQFPKSDWYHAWGHPVNRNLLSQTDRKAQSNMRRQVSSVYSMSSMVHYEPFVDECTDKLVRRFSEFAADGQSFDLGHWLQCYAFDVIGKITFSESFGCLDDGKDPQGIMKAIENLTSLSTIMGLYPGIYPLVFATLQPRSQGKDAKGTAFVMQYSDEQIALSQGVDKLPEGPQNFIAKLVQLQKERPEAFTNEAIRLTGFANIAAGSDTTSITLSALIYHLSRNPAIMQKLRKELADGEADGSVSNPIVFREASMQPYLQAVIKETIRIHPAAGLTLPRVVPEGGRQLAGSFFPADTVVGINPWVAHHNEEVFGRDAHLFRPERWLDASREDKSIMESYFLSFSQGARTCLGKNVSMLELSKALPRLIREFDFTMEKEGEWTNENYFFVKPVGFRCYVTKRGSY
ncbi:Pisatin demethylase [Colletotrichum tropicale]|nr:Pisatin demethylase [Colletotrichum tropicale]